MRHFFQVLVIAVMSLCAGASSAQADPCSPLPAANSPGFQKRLESFMNSFCYTKLAWQHDAHRRSSEGVHYPYIQVYYSPAMWTWLTVSKRQGEAPDGAMLVKEQYSDLTGPVQDWAIMVKDHTGAWDGWYWGDLGPPATQAAFDPAQGCPEATFAVAGFGQYCLNCHASAAGSQSTFASTTYVNGASAHSQVTNPPLAGDYLGFQTLANRAREWFSQPALLPAMDREPSLIFAKVRRLPFSAERCMVPVQYDHVVSPAKPGSKDQFLTSDQCMGCHDATGTLSPTRADLPRMLYPDALADPIVNLSPNGEWRYSMMGLAGRDPIFFSQLNSETTLHADLDDHPMDSKAFVQDLCLHCHGVMGQRQYNLDTGGKFFTREQLADANSQYGALGRDGVSCASCHRIAAEGLGTEATFTGNFKVGPSTEAYGPYDQGVSKLSMKNALNIDPKATTEHQIQGSALCGSCHTIILPVYTADGKHVIENGKPKVFTEQATFLEWLDSDFADNGSHPRSCQDCHMPTEFKGSKLAYKIANIEDNTFPVIEYTAPEAELTLTTRDPYYRHLLLGINVFGLEMFKQFRPELGLYAVDPMLRNPEKTRNGIDVALDEATRIASERAAIVTLPSAISSLGLIQAQVTVETLTGHSFPSGVGFRRAFLNFQILDKSNNVLWASGDTNSEGVIVDTAGNPLVTEFFSPTQQSFQTHRWAQNPITRDDQVQIYEELAVNPEGQLTTSFLGLDHKVKENRLLPKGWSPTGPFANETKAVGTGLDPDYLTGTGFQTVTYKVPVTDALKAAAKVRATLYYQAIPPYYLRQRATDAVGPDTDRLADFARTLDVSKPPVQGWKLKISQTAERRL